MEVSGDESSFSGRKINAVQIGLGTFGTVIQNLIGSHEEWDPIVGWLMEVVSERNPRRFQGVAVEPVREHIERLRKQAANQLPHFRLVQAAIGEDDVEDVEMTVLTKTAHDKLLASVPPDVQQQLARDLVYIRNMSCVGGPHPGFDLCRQKAWRKFGVDICLEPFRTSVWSYGRLARSLDFCGCELFIVDAEGHDTQILRSMIQHCSEEEMYGRCAWPDVVVFESAGLCDSKEGAASEAAVVSQLESHGYFVLVRCRMNTDMVRREALEKSKQLKRWVDKTVCQECRSRELPMSYLEGRMLCRLCCDNWWENWSWNWP